MISDDTTLEVEGDPKKHVCDDRKDLSQRSDSLPYVLLLASEIPVFRSICVSDSTISCIAGLNSFSC